MTTLGPKFWSKLSNMSNSLGMDPKELLAVMYYESGLNPSIINKDGGATGLIQFMPDTLKRLGFEGSNEDFREFDAERQLDYVEKYIRAQMEHKGGPFKSATQYYVANLWPVALKAPGVIAENPNTPIIERDPKVKKYPNVSLDYERAAYKANSKLDVDQDGIISYGDLDRVMSGVKSSSGFRFALNQLENGREYAVGTPLKSNKNHENNSLPKIDEEYLSQVNNLLDKYLSQISAAYQQSMMIKKADLKKYFDNHSMVISIKSTDIINSLEFARILCLALDEEAQAEAWVASDGKNVEVSCAIYGPQNLCVRAVDQLSKSLAEAFEDATKKIGGVKIITLVNENTSANYPRVDLKLAQSAYRKFHYKFINRN